MLHLLCRTAQYNFFKEGFILIFIGENIMGWLFLGLTIVSEVTGTTMMKLSEGYTKLIPSILSFVFYLGALALLTMTLKYLGMGISYAIWSGVGIVLVTIIGYLFFKEQITIQKIVFISLILFGVIGLKLTTN